MSICFATDDCWLSTTRDSNDRLIPDADRFPRGMKFLADYVHSKGLKFGVYAVCCDYRSVSFSCALSVICLSDCLFVCLSANAVPQDCGSRTCAGYAGSLDHVTLDVQTFADWGADYLKLVLDFTKHYLCSLLCFCCVVIIRCLFEF